MNEPKYKVDDFLYDTETCVPFKCTEIRQRKGTNVYFGNDTFSIEEQTILYADHLREILNDPEKKLQYNVGMTSENSPNIVEITDDKLIMNWELPHDVAFEGVHPSNYTLTYIDGFTIPKSCIDCPMVRFNFEVPNEEEMKKIETEDYEPPVKALGCRITGNMVHPLQVYMDHRMVNCPLRQMNAERFITKDENPKQESED